VMHVYVVRLYHIQFRSLTVARAFCTARLERKCSVLIIWSYTDNFEISILQGKIRQHLELAERPVESLWLANPYLDIPKKSW
jgi:hypothetical protein